MSQLDNLITRIRARPPEADFADVRALLEAFGWTLKGGKGSYNAFRRPRAPDHHRADGLRAEGEEGVPRPGLQAAGPSAGIVQPEGRSFMARRF